MRLPLPSVASSPPPPSPEESPAASGTKAGLAQWVKQMPMKLPWEGENSRDFKPKMGQVQNDQSRTGDHDEEFSFTDNFMATSDAPTTTYDDDNNDSFIVWSQKMGPKRAKNSVGILVGEKEKGEERERAARNLMTFSSETIRMKNVLHFNIDNVQKRNNSQNEEKQSRDTNYNKEIMSGDPTSLLNSLLNKTMECEDEEHSGKPFTFPNNISSSPSQINSSMHLRKVKRTLWWGGGYHRFDGRNICYYATMCLVLWMLVTSSWIPVDAITTSSGERGESLSYS